MDSGGRKKKEKKCSSYDKEIETGNRDVPRAK